MERLNPIIETTPQASSKELAKKCRAQNSQVIWSHLSRLTAELISHGSVKDGDRDLIEKQKLLTEKLADKNPEHVALAIKLHQEGTDERPGKPWFPHISDLMVHIHPLERAERNRQATRKAREQAWYSGKDESTFVEDDPQVRAAAVAQWHETEKPEMAAKAEKADNELLQPHEREARDLREARRQSWRDPANDPESSIRRLKRDMQAHAAGIL